MKDYYKALGISPASNQQSIKKVYKTLARKYHPDKNQDSSTEEIFKDISEAYSILSHPEKKKKYDQTLENMRKNIHHTPPPFSQPSSSHSVNEPLFLDIFTKVKISLEESHLGCIKNIPFKIKKNSNYERKNITVHIPKGVRHNQQLKMKNQGHQFEVQSGDLFLEIKIQKHSLFKIKNRDLILILPISISDAILGTTKVLPTLTGQAEMSLPPVTHSGSLFLLKNQGLYLDDGVSRGDLILQIIIDIPEQITEEEKQWFKNFILLKNVPPLVAQFNIQAQKLITHRAS